ncbi:carboxylesterase family protein [Microbacterium sp. HJ5]
MRASTTHNRSHSRPFVVAATLMLTLAMAGLGAAPASAGQPPGSFSEEYSFESWDCGYPMQVEGQVSGRFRERPNPQGEGPALVHENVQFSETWTNAEGATFTLSGRYLSKDLHITAVEGSVYQVIAQQSGQPFVISSGGEVIARDRGNVRITFTIDVETDAFEFIDARLNGPHVGFETDLCKLVAPIVGTDSASYLTPRPLGTTAAGMGYYEYLPPSYDEGGSPLLITANGYGENGDGSAAGLEALLFTGVARFIDVGGWPLDRPFVVLATQHIEQPGVPGGSVCETVPWPGSCIMQLQHEAGHPPQSPCTTPGELRDFIAYAVAEYDVDPSRVYVTGLSCGAFGVWEYLGLYGDEQVAAAVPVAGDGRPMWADRGCAMAEVPVWAIHGEFDDVVNPAGSIDTIEGISGCPGVTPDRVQLSIYPGLMHEGWDQAYSGSEGDDIYSWMLSYTRE